MLKALDPFYFTLAFWFKGLLAFSACFFFFFFFSLLFLASRINFMIFSDYQ
ncbi:uncharacterized protein DS421_19g661660 [Arachis hypogaea]|uniref:Uncharacterized protein n=1 Tax=Arachis hypogaea TaxID=3818 RepID=A0A6B9VCV3_ARAHY|nr:uncharacterized protein DS421_19g661660 [Arachis hypogaea]